jgi:hypothetical protein
MCNVETYLYRGGVLPLLDKCGKMVVISHNTVRRLGEHPRAARRVITLTYRRNPFSIRSFYDLPRVMLFLSN